MVRPPNNIKNWPPHRRFFYWIETREWVREQKETKQPKPWTTDPILQQYKFCNVRRMDDRVSRWLYTHWYRPYKNHPNMLLAVTLGRQLNNPDSLQSIGFPKTWDPDRVEDILNRRAAEGLKNFSAAYMITGTLGGSKVHQIIRKVVDPLFHNPPTINTNSMEETAEALLPYAGFSTFIAGQVVADLRWALSGAWKDRMTWAPIGPGSKRGMNRLYSNQKDAKISKEDFYEKFKEIMNWVSMSLDPNLFSKLEAMDIQNCLCEFDKYERTLWNEGRPKQKYPGMN